MAVCELVYRRFTIKDYASFCALAQHDVSACSVSQESFAQRLALSFGCWRGEDFIGYVLVSGIYESKDIEAVYVEASYRRQGVASNLLLELQQAVAFKDRLLLEVHEENQKAIALYKKRGFQKIAERKAYYKDGAAAYIMAWQKGGEA